MESPAVLFLVFNRPEVTARVFAQIRAAKPARLFVAADGPRVDRPGEAERCANVRRLIDEGIDWNCQVERLYREENLGCRRAVSEAISWFFQNVEAGMILEDDCLPDPTFFSFCAELLERYRDNPKVMHIGGFNPVGGQPSFSTSYTFWHFGSIWGWATWRRAWAHYDVTMRDWPEFVRQGRMLEHCQSAAEATARTPSFEQVHAGTIDTWDFQWAFARIFHRGLSITPCRNLISNIGFGADASHTHDSNDRRSKMQGEKIPFPLRHPAKVEPDRVFGAKYWEGIREPGSVSQRRPLLKRIVSKILRMCGRAGLVANVMAMHAVGATISEFLTVLGAAS